jgi:integrase
VRSAFGRYLDLPATDLDRATIIKILDAIARTGRVATASRTIAYGKACYGWAVKRGTLTVNPFVNLPSAPVTQRDHVLSDDELAAIWRGTAGAGPFNSIVRVLMLTGQRRSEAGGMVWAELSDDLSFSMASVTSSLAPSR